MTTTKADRTVGDPFPDRRILHCDMDCFYAAVHMRDDPSLAGKPLIIGGSPSGRGVVAAANYEVRRFGVHSAMPCSQAVRLCPHATILRPDFERYQRESERVFDIFRGVTDVIQPVSIDEAYLDVTDCWRPYGSATGVAEAIREEVRRVVNLTVSVGVAPNRLVAKIASDFNKPDGLTVVRPGRVLDFLAPLDVRVLMGVGPATERILHEEFRVHKIAELREIELPRLTARLGRYGSVLWRYARGIDDRPVQTTRERKSLSAETTYTTDLVELEQMEQEIERLAARVTRGLEKRDLHGSSVTLKVRYEDFTTVTRSRTLERPVRDASELARIGRDLLQKTSAGERAVRLLGIGLSKFHTETSRDDPQLFLPGLGLAEGVE